jgi:hypothetical protein
VHTRDGKELPVGSMLVHATGAGRRWVVDGLAVRELDEEDVTPAVGGTLAAPAGELLLALWGRTRVDAGPSPVVDAWLHFGGN